jgi:hypothetical protein
MSRRRTVERALGHDAIGAHQDRVVGAVALRVSPVVPLVGGDVLDVRLRSLVVRRLQALRRRHLGRRLDGDHGGGLAGGVEDVDADRGVLGVTKRVPDQGSHAFGVEADGERLTIGRLQSPQVQGQAACLAVADLHRGEVAVGRDRRPQVVRGRRHPVDLDAGHAARLALGCRSR